ncbi:MarR family transcriptional regulator [Azospirillum sp. A1-3]|uniref:MarR family winged helix-turn-helix transcriptional regulator n=1 Tax=Azospirillum sp. A1-3 TaxID=185874 RepID=UPI00207702EF|nr:MarR family transcriptional regulator [Azospirillum sp. A1-3]MCM8735580.1 MarR family transcriptional regulator [Azospirillum sp. A1-3]
MSDDERTAAELAAGSRMDRVNSPIRSSDYQALAEFRHTLRRFLAFSEAAARNSGLTPQQHQAILAIKGHGDGGMSIGDLADKLLVRHHSAGELVDRLVKADLVIRQESADDRRRVVLVLTPQAEAVLEDLSAVHLDELRKTKPLLLALLNALP